MTTQAFLLSAWNAAPFAAAGLAILVYLAANRFKPGKRFAIFMLGIVIFLAALASPLDALAQGYLFSAHMLEHMLLLMVVPLLWMLSLTPQSKETAPRRGIMAGMEKIGLFPALNWAAGVGAMWLWHVPALCNAATVSGPVRTFQVISLLLLGFAFWWPINGPRLDQRLVPWTGMLYLITACFTCILLGIWITFSPVAICSAFNVPVDRYGIMPLIRNQWNLSAATDQQIGGLIMWVPSCLIYLGGTLSLLARWSKMSNPASSASLLETNKNVGKNHG